MYGIESRCSGRCTAVNDDNPARARVSWAGILSPRLQPALSVATERRSREWRIQRAVLRPTGYPLQMKFCKFTQVPPDNAKHTFGNSETTS